MRAETLIWLAPMPLLFWIGIAPRSAWRRLVAWRYRNPDTVQPSGDGFFAYQTVAWVMIVALLLVGGTFDIISRQREAGQRVEQSREQEKRYQDCLRRADPVYAEGLCVIYSPQPLENRR